MKNHQKVWQWVSAAVMCMVGFVLVMNDSSAGWFLIILGITYLGASTRTGQSWVMSNPRIARWGLVVVTLLLIILAIVVGVVLLVK